MSKRGRRNPIDAASLESTGMLSAYTINAGAGVVGASATATSAADKTFLSKRNKNQKKREQQQQKQQAAAAEEDGKKSEAGKNDHDDEAVDNWEDNWDDAEVNEEDDAPPPPEFVIDTDAVEERKRQEEAAAKKAAAAASKEAAAKEQAAKKKQKQQQQPQQQQPTKKPQKGSTKVESALKDLNTTVDQVSALFQSLAVAAAESPSKKPAAVVPAAAAPSQEVNKDDVKAEREAKKKAKQAAKTAAKDKKVEEVKSEQQPVQEEQKDNKATAAGSEKSKEEIKAEREAKKKAKQAARAAAKDGGGEGGSKGPVASEAAAPKEVVAKEVPPKEAAAGQKSKAELRKERRELQEQQREAKKAEAEAKKEGAVKTVKKDDSKGPSKAGPSDSTSSKAVGQQRPQRVPDDIQADRVSVEKKMQKNLASQNLPQRPKAQRKVMLFSHLHQYERELSISKDLPVVGSHIHPAIVQLGLQYAEGTIQGSNARCIAFMNAMKRVIVDYTTPEDRELSRDLDSKLKTHITFLKGCRNHSTSMGNAIRFLKAKIRKVEAGTSEAEAKDGLVEAIERFVHDIHLSAVQISITACQKIRDGDVILTYGCSSLLKAVFLRAAESGLKFRVIVADGRPKFEGRQMAQHLINAGVHCTYTLVHSLSYVIGEVTKVFLGAHAVLANGHVMSRVGTSQVAMIAKAQNVPVLVCCETYKFSERVQTDSFVFNELGDPDDLVATGTGVTALEDWRDLSALNLLYLNYDVTPASLVDAIISEISVIPCTSVPVVLRLKALDLGQ